MTSNRGGREESRGVEVVDLSALADLVADRVVSRLLSAHTPRSTEIPQGCALDGQDAKSAQTLLTAAQVASRFGVSAEWVRDNAERLEAVRLGDGPRPRLRFDAKRVLEALTRRSGSGESGGRGSRVPTANPQGRRPAESGNALDMLPLRELKPRPFPRNGPGAADTAPGSATRKTPSPRTQPNPPRADSAPAGWSSPLRARREESA